MHIHVVPFCSIRSHEATKRKKISNGPAALDGPKAKKAKVDADSSSEESSSDEEDAAPAKKPPQG